jgi:alanine-glyoxylate transaminase/serine-glyoxylate transaminase/serine-pyruvate transaminase
LRGRSFRVGHMGVCGPAEILTTLGAIERALHRLGETVDFGASLAAAQRALAQGASSGRPLAHPTAASVNRR